MSAVLSSELPAGFKLTTGFLSPDQAEEYFHSIKHTVDWQQDEVSVFGGRHKIPRKHQWFADPGLSYRWSGLEMHANDWFPALATIRDKVSTECGGYFNSVLANLYRDGNDSMGWHADDEPELGRQPVIASLSLGAERDFQLRRKGETRVCYTFVLPAGSLLLMTNNSQHEWQHALPKRKRVLEARINLTFRHIVT